MTNTQPASSPYASGEDHFRACTEASPLGIFHCDVSGSYTYTNERWQQTYELTFTQALGEGWMQALDPEEAVLVRADWMQAVVDGREYDREHRLRRNDGTVIFVRSRARPIHNASGQIEGFVGTVADITDRRNAERALFEERQHLTYIIAGTRAGTWEWNVETDETRFNQQWARIVGYSLEEWDPRSMQAWRDRAHPEDLARSKETLAQHFRGACPDYECEVRLRHRDGRWIWVLSRGRVQTWTADGKPQWMFGFDIDITELKQKEEALRKAQVFLERTGELAGVGGWEVDLASGKVIWSDQTCRIHGVDLGYSPDVAEAIAFYAPQARPVIAAAVERGIAEGVGWDLELPLLRTTGEQIWVRAVGTVERKNGRPVRLIGAFQDVTAARRLQAELGQQHELLRVTLQSMGDGVITTDDEGNVAWLNPAAERMTGWSSQEAKGRTLNEVFTVIDDESRQQGADSVIARFQVREAAGQCKHKVLLSRNGSVFGIEHTAAPIRSEAGAKLGVVLVFRDVTEQRRLSGEMSYRATHDTLTGLVNRTEFETIMGRVLKAAHEQRTGHALLYIDIDHFKLINDTCGHSIGDDLLQQIAKLLSDATRSGDTLARLGGDEFAVILEHCSDEAARLVAERICDRMDSFRFVHDGRSFRVGVSIGLVLIDSRWSTIEAIIQAADSSCYAAKEGGRNRVHIWLDTDTAIRRRGGEMQWAMRIERALDENRFVLHAQRIQPLGPAEQGVRAEALLRMVDEEGALVMPGAFLAAAERFHLASSIDRWVLRKALDWLLALPDVRPLQTLCINLSGHSIGDRAFHKYAIDVLTEAGPRICQRVCLEITETAAVTNITDAAAFARQIRALGVRVALDDFGAGASSFGYLKTLPVDYLKIDGGFVRNLLDDPLDEATVRCFAEVARIVGVKTVAECVDRPEVLQKLREMKIDYAQGFLVHRPAPIDELLPRSRVCAYSL